MIPLNCFYSALLGNETILCSIVMFNDETVNIFNTEEPS